MRLDCFLGARGWVLDPEAANAVVQDELPELAIGNGAATVAMIAEVGADRRVAVDREELAPGACGAAAVAEDNDLRLQDFDLGIEQTLGVMLDRLEVWVLLGVAFLP